MEVEFSFQQRMKEVEDRFSGDQESVEKRFQADVLRLEQDYQSELKALCESQAELRLGLEAQLQEAVENVEKERRVAEESVARERERLDQRREKDKHELESRHEEKVKDLAAENQQLQQEVDALVDEAQTKEIELSRQLNDLHSRLQESLETRDELLAQSERKALHCELLVRERIELERNDLKVKVEELETLLRQAAVDFELERKELQEEVTVLEKRLKDVPESDGEELVPERDALRNGVQGPEVDLNQGSSPAEEASVMDDEENSLTKVQDALAEDSEDRNYGCVNAAHDGGGDVTDPAASEEDLLIWLPKGENLQPEGHQVVGGDAETSCCSPGIFCSASCEGRDPDGSVLSENRSGVDATSKAASPRMPCEQDATDQQFKGENIDGGGENGDAPESCEEERKPQDVPALKDNGAPPEDERSHENAVDTSGPEERRDPAEMFPVDFEVPCLSHNSHERRREAEPPTAAQPKDEFTHDAVKPPDRGADCEGGGCPLVALQVLYNTAAGENVLLREKVSLLRQKTEVLEDLLAQSGDKIQASRLALEENHGLKVQVLVLLEHVRELELKALGVAHLQVKYEDCALENARLRQHNRELERSVWSLEGGPSVFRDLQKHLEVDEIAGMRDKDATELCGVEGRGFSARARPDLDGSGQLEVEPRPAVDLRGCCAQLERQNWDLRRALTELQDQSQALDRTTLAQR